MSFFVQFFYQPFLNLLAGLYYGLDLVTGGRADMGVTVIIFTLIIRVLLLPLTIAGTRSEEEKRELEESVKQIRREYSASPMEREVRIKKLMKSNRRIVISSSITLTIHIILALILWRIFAVGLLGEDLHLLYDFIPRATEPFNLTFLGKYDLTHPNVTLNLIQSGLIFLLELEVSLFSSFLITRRDVIMTQLVLPLVSYLIFMNLPAGKKLFIITTLCFSIVYVTTRQIRHWWHGLKIKFKVSVKDEAGKS